MFFEEARATGDNDGEAYSRPLVMASVRTEIESANEALSGFPEEFYSAVQYATDCAFSAGQGYQSLEFSEKYLAKLEGLIARSHTGGEATK